MPKVKCKLCKTQIDKDTAFKISARSYVCSEDEWNTHLENEEYREKFFNVVNYMVRDLEDCTNANFGIRANSFAKRVYDRYSFVVIYLTLDKVAEDVVKYISRNNIGSVENRFLYCMKVIESNIGYGMEAVKKMKLAKESSKRLRAVSEEVEDDIFKKRKKSKERPTVNKDLLDEFFK